MDLSSRSLSELTDLKNKDPPLMKKKSSKISDIIIEEESPTAINKMKTLKAIKPQRKNSRVMSAAQNNATKLLHKLNTKSYMKKSDVRINEKKMNAGESVNKSTTCADNSSPTWKDKLNRESQLKQNSKNETSDMSRLLDLNSGIQLNVDTTGGPTGNNHSYL